MLWFCLVASMWIYQYALFTYIYIRVSKLGHHWFRLWLATCLAPSHHLKKCWLIVETSGTTFTAISIKIKTFASRKRNLKMSSTKWRPFLRGLNILTLYVPVPYIDLHVGDQIKLSTSSCILSSISPFANICHRSRSTLVQEMAYRLFVAKLWPQAKFYLSQ